MRQKLPGLSISFWVANFAHKIKVSNTLLSTGKAGAAPINPLG